MIKHGLIILVMMATFVGGLMLGGDIVQAAPPATSYTSQNPPFDPSTTKSVKPTGLASMKTMLVDTGSLGARDPVSVTIAILNVILTLLAMGFLILLVYGGFIWIAARGSEEDITRAKTIIKRAVLGLIIILATYGISNLIFNLVNTYAQKA